MKTLRSPGVASPLSHARERRRAKRYSGKESGEEAARSEKYRHFILWLDPRAGKMTQIVHCGWLPERARWSHLACSGLTAVYPRKKNFPESHVTYPLLTKFVRSRWWIMASFFSCEFMDLDFVLVLKHARKKKEIGQYPAILTSHLVNNPYALSGGIASRFLSRSRLLRTRFVLQCALVLQRKPAYRLEPQPD